MAWALSNSSPISATDATVTAFQFLPVNSDMTPKTTKRAKTLKKNYSPETLSNVTGIADEISPISQRQEISRYHRKRRIEAILSMLRYIVTALVCIGVSNCMRERERERENDREVDLRQCLLEASCCCNCSHRRSLQRSTAEWCHRLELCSTYQRQYHRPLGHKETVFIPARHDVTSSTSDHHNTKR